LLERSQATGINFQRVPADADRQQIIISRIGATVDSGMAVPDPSGQFYPAIDDVPVIFFEQNIMFDSKEEVTDEPYTIRFRKAQTRS